MLSAHPLGPTDELSTPRSKPHEKVPIFKFVGGVTTQPLGSIVEAKPLRHGGTKDYIGFQDDSPRAALTYTV